MLKSGTHEECWKTPSDSTHKRLRCFVKKNITLVAESDGARRDMRSAYVSPVLAGTSTGGTCPNRTVERALPHWV